MHSSRSSHSHYDHDTFQNNQETTDWSFQKSNNPEIFDMRTKSLNMLEENSLIG